MNRAGISNTLTYSQSVSGTWYFTDVQYVLAVIPVCYCTVHAFKCILYILYYTYIMYMHWYNWLFIIFIFKGCGFHTVPYVLVPVFL